jgi:hypothetical protein
MCYSADLRAFDVGRDMRPAAAADVVDIIAVEGNAAVVPCPRAESRPPAATQFDFNGTTTVTTTCQYIPYLLIFILQMNDADISR